MPIQALKENIEKEKRLIAELAFFVDKLSKVSDTQAKKALEKNVKSIQNRLQILNNSFPLIVKQITIAKQLPSNAVVKPAKLQLITLGHEGEDTFVTIKRGDKERYLKELHISETSLKDLKKSKEAGVEQIENEYRSPSFYVKISNKFFLDLSNKLTKKGTFRDLSRSLKKGGFVFLFKSYVSMIFFTTLLSFFAAILIATFFLFFSLGLEAPFLFAVDFSAVNFFMRLAQVIWILPMLPLATFLLMLFYPNSEGSSIATQIENELPFATIQMSAIAGSGIEPSNIFKIIALNKEYPFIRKESMKLMNQINLYGFDLVNALSNIAMASPSKEWTDLLNGFATTIKSGGELGEFLTKRAESLMFQYRIKREKATKAAETFMDIYISVVIAAPMLMMLLLIMMSISNIGIPLGVPAITVIVTSSVALINLVFLVFLHINQKKF